MKVLAAIAALAAVVIISVIMNSRDDSLSGMASAPVDVPHFSTQPATGIFADGGGGYTSAECAAALDANASSYMYNGDPINQETVPQNQQPHPPGSSATGIASPRSEERRV